MIHRFTCEPIVPDIAGPLVIEWDDESGTVTGPGAAHIRRWLRAGVVPLHPYPASHDLARGPLQSRADLAAIIGVYHRLPDELLADYPAPIDATDDDPTIDELAAIFPDGLPDSGDKSPATQPLADIFPDGLPDAGDQPPATQPLAAAVLY